MQGWRGDRKDLMTLTLGRGHGVEVCNDERSNQGIKDEGEEMSDEGTLRQWCLFDIKCN